MRIDLSTLESSEGTDNQFIKLQNQFFKLRIRFNKLRIDLTI